MNRKTCRTRFSRIVRAAAITEILESRQLLSSTLGADLKLTVIGTDLGDTIAIAPASAGQIQVSEAGLPAALFPADKVNSILIMAMNGNDSVTISAALTQPATIFGGDGNDTISSGAGIDQIFGEAGDDLISAGEGDDTIEGGDGADRFLAESFPDGSDQFTGGAGNDTVDYSRSAAAITLQAFSPNDPYVIESSAGTDRTDFFETLIGSAGNDQILSATIGRDDGLYYVDGGPGDDRISITPRGSTIHGGAGNDYLSDTTPVDSISELYFFGDDGDDTIRATRFPCVRIISGGRGIDTADYTDSRTGGERLSLDNIANDSGGGSFINVPFSNILDDIENLVGSFAGPCILIGSDADNILTTYIGGDQIFGLGGNDVIITNSGKFIQNPQPDTIDGGLGIDACEDNPRDTIVGVELLFALDAAPDVRGAARATPTTRSKPPQASATLSAKGKLSVFGTDGDDQIRITQTSVGMTVSIGALTQNFAPASRVKSITVNARAGNDKATLFKSTGTGRVTRPAIIYGGDGNDTIFGGDGNIVNGDVRGGDQLIGGRGNDSLIGGNGRDYLDGGDQTAARFDATDRDDGIDTLVGGAGNDYVALQARNGNAATRFRGSKIGFAAEDQISGIEGIFAGRGNDLVEGDVAPNFISGGGGNDTIRGGTGQDQILGNAGIDLIYVDDDDAFDFVLISDDDASDICYYCDGRSRARDFVNASGDELHAS
ncbi:hypothetical protein BH09PLA1_BH09PLA1_17490 [soil metagenome]